MSVRSDKLDTAMSVLTSLLTDLEQELHHHNAHIIELDLGSSTPPVTQSLPTVDVSMPLGHVAAGAASISQVSSVSASGCQRGNISAQHLADSQASVDTPTSVPIGKLDAALSTLTAQLAHLEDDLREHNAQVVGAVEAFTARSLQTEGVFDIAAPLTIPTPARHGHVRPHAVSPELGTVQGQVRVLNETLSMKPSARGGTSCSTDSLASTVGAAEEEPGPAEHHEEVSAGAVGDEPPGRVDDSRVMDGTGRQGTGLAVVGVGLVSREESVVNSVAIDAPTSTPKSATAARDITYQESVGSAELSAASTATLPAAPGDSASDMLETVTCNHVKSPECPFEQAAFSSPCARTPPQGPDKQHAIVTPSNTVGVMAHPLSGGPERLAASIGAPSCSHHDQNVSCRHTSRDVFSTNHSDVNMAPIQPIIPPSFMPPTQQQPQEQKPQPQPQQQQQQQWSPLPQRSRQMSHDSSPRPSFGSMHRAAARNTMFTGSRMQLPSTPRTSAICTQTSLVMLPPGTRHVVVPSGGSARSSIVVQSSCGNSGAQIASSVRVGSSCEAPNIPRSISPCSRQPDRCGSQLSAHVYPPSRSVTPPMRREFPAICRQSTASPRRSVPAARAPSFSPSPAPSCRTTPVVPIRRSVASTPAYQVVSAASPVGRTSAELSDSCTQALSFRSHSSETGRRRTIGNASSKVLVTARAPTPQAQPLGGPSTSSFAFPCGAANSGSSGRSSGSFPTSYGAEIDRTTTPLRHSTPVRNARLLEKNVVQRGVMLEQRSCTPGLLPAPRQENCSVAPQQMSLVSSVVMPISTSPAPQVCAAPRTPRPTMPQSVAPARQAWSAAAPSLRTGSHGSGGSSVVGALNLAGRSQNRLLPVPTPIVPPLTTPTPFVAEISPTSRSTTPSKFPEATATLASEYIGDASDPIDMMLSWCLMSLNREILSKLTVRRLAASGGKGRYEIDGRNVSLRWSDKVDSTELLAREEEVMDTRGSELPLLQYLSQTAHVAASLSGQKAPTVTRIPPEKRLTFWDVTSSNGSTFAATTATANADDSCIERVGSMRLACEQAKIREQAAQAYESESKGAMSALSGLLNYTTWL
eukprot:TRINITY_DN6456_c1_g1_i1.p1 TRINITY_DN6456_c1_g1~~TRINITY_DN6456_c1_g1_i1.p1  ORF type:complete len:1092 (-),score=96.26 TRINITY_DN6456_c1_g1_i1:61-3336(-)